MKKNRWFGGSIWLLLLLITVLPFLGIRAEAAPKTSKITLIRGKAKRLQVTKVRPIGASSKVRWISSKPKERYLAI